jgi:hypothetical protein
MISEPLFLNVLRKKSADNGFRSASDMEGQREAAVALNNSFLTQKITHEGQGELALANITWLGLRTIICLSDRHAKNSSPLKLATQIFAELGATYNSSNQPEDPAALYKPTQRLLFEANSALSAKNQSAVNLRLLDVAKTALRIIAAFPQTFETSLLLYPQGVGAAPPNLNRVPDPTDWAGIDAADAIRRGRLEDFAAGKLNRWKLYSIPPEFIGPAKPSAQAASPGL